MSTARTLAIGLDGCSWNVLDPLLETGDLPNLAALRDSAASGVLESTIPFYTGPAWASFATAASPAAHGIYDFLMLREGDELTPAHESDLRRVTYYEQLAREGKRSVLVNFPLDQDGLDGAVVVNSWLTVDEARRIFPVDRRERYRRQLEAYRSYPTTFGSKLSLHLEDLLAVEKTRFELARQLFEHEDWDHFFILFSSTDWLGHAATGLFLNGDEGARAAFRRLYGQLDGYVGWLLEHAEDVTAVVLSDHGQCEETHVVRVNALLRDLGHARLLRERPTEVSAALSSERLRGTLRVPASLGSLRHSRVLRPVARLARRTLRRGGVELLTPTRGDDVDRVLSRAFMPTVASYAVHSRDGTPEQIEEIRGRLLEVALDDGRPAFDGVWTLAELYGREAEPGAPALVFAPAVGVRPAMTVHKPYVARVRQAGKGAHQRDGIFLLSGSGVQAGDLGRPSLYDVAPTLLWRMGSGVPADADGRVLFEAFDDRLASTLELHEVDPTPAARPPVAAASSADVEGRLRALGYL